VEDFQNLLDKFIVKYVLCDSCNNPETVLEVTPAKKIEQRCKACGHFRLLPSTGKLHTFILNNPPNVIAGAKAAKGMDKAQRKLQKIAKQQGKDVEDVEAAQKAAIRTPSATPSKVKEQGVDVADPKAFVAPDAAAEELDWAIDTSEEAVRQREAEISGAVNSLILSNDSERPMAERLEIFEAFVNDAKTKAKFPAKEVLGQATRLDCMEKVGDEVALRCVAWRCIALRRVAVGRRERTDRTSQCCLARSNEPVLPCETLLFFALQKLLLVFPKLPSFASAHRWVDVCRAC